jgi:hypothetical protein
MTIKMLETVKVLGTWRSGDYITLEKGKKYKATHAMNQPDWQKSGKMFAITKEGDSVLVESSQYVRG